MTSDEVRSPARAPSGGSDGHAERSAPLAAERHRILTQGIGARTEFPNACTHELFERQVARDPSATAVVFGRERLTYGELNERANQVAHYLRGRGVGPDTLVGVALHRTPARLMRAVRDATPATWGVILQFPFYAGIAGVISYTALSARIACPPS